MMAYRIFDHTADLGIEVSGGTVAEVYAGAALALFDLIADATTVRAEEERAVGVEGEDEADLLVNFLREVLYAWNGTAFLVKECDISEVGPRRVTAILRGEPFDPSRHRIKREIKAVTYHRASVCRTEAGWLGRVVFDV
jgi:SHS2 domain-containing protein